jgi:hypothetical protein
MSEITRSLRVATVVDTVPAALQFAEDHAEEFASYPSVAISPFREVDGNGNQIGDGRYAVSLSGLAPSVES